MDDGASERLLEEPPKPAEGGDAPAAGGVVSSAGAKLVPSATGIAKLVRSATGISSGIGADEEYRRSIGALFAVYWLMRSTPHTRGARTRAMADRPQQTRARRTHPPSYPRAATQSASMASAASRLASTTDGRRTSCTRSLRRRPTRRCRL